MLKAGDIIPLDIPISNEQNQETTLKNYLNHKYLVIYFYPKDLTPGCTQEACEFRDYNKDIEAQGAKIIGISSDSPKLHKKFREKERLNFELLSDSSHTLQEKFGVWEKKKMFGREFVGTLRTTFVTNSNGEIIKVWGNVNPDGHAKEIYEFLVMTNSN